MAELQGSLHRNLVPSQTLCCCLRKRASQTLTHYLAVCGNEQVKSCRHYLRTSQLSFSFLILDFSVRVLAVTFVFAMWPASEAAGCPAKPNVGFIKILKFNWSPGHSANMLLGAGRFVNRY